LAAGSSPLTGDIAGSTPFIDLNRSSPERVH